MSPLCPFFAFGEHLITHVLTWNKYTANMGLFFPENRRKLVFRLFNKPPSLRKDEV